MENRTDIENSPTYIFTKNINIQKEKEKARDIWFDSEYKDIVNLQANNAGNVGEKFIQEICEKSNISASIDGSRTKKIGGGLGDGIILGKNIEIKTSHKGSNSSSFQHELGEKPWKSEFMIFIDVEPKNIYVTIFKNFDEEFYKSGNKCEPYFPSKSITWRKKSGAFKLDTTVKINEENISKGYTFKVTKDSTIDDLKEFIVSNIK